MKQKYTLNVANSEIHIVTEEPKKDIDTVVGVVDRRLREIHLHSKGISRIDAALLLSLECVAEKIKIQKQLRDAEAENERLLVIGESKDREIASLERELETLRSSLALASSHGRQQTKRAPSAQLGFDDIDEEEQPRRPEPETKASAVEEILSDPEPSQDKVKARRRGRRPGPKSDKGDKPAKVRSMFDLISYDDI